MPNKTTIIVAALFIFLLGAAPSARAQMGPGAPGAPMGPGPMGPTMMGECPECPMGPGKHMMHHEKMGTLMEMMKETMGIVKDMEHVPGSAQKKKLTEMMGKLDEMIKTHEEMGAKHEVMKGRMKMHHERMGSLLKMLKETMGVVRDLEHVPSSAQKKKLTEMMGALEEMIKTHAEMGKMRGM